MTAYESIECGAADECEPLRGRRSRTFTLTHLLVACGAVCVCAIAATTVVNTHLANFDDDSALANFDLGSALDDDSAFDGDSAFDDELALADSDDGSDDGSDDDSDDDSGDDSDDAADDDSDDDDSQEGAQLGQYEKSPRAKCYDEAGRQRYAGLQKVQWTYNNNKQKCSTTTKQCRYKCQKTYQGCRKPGCRKCYDQCFKADKKCHDDNKKRYNTDTGIVRSGYYTKRKGCYKLSNARPKPKLKPKQKHKCIRQKQKKQ